MNPLVARTIAAVGVLLSVASIWTPILEGGYESSSISYWGGGQVGPKHGVGITILVLAIVAAFGVVLAFALQVPVFDRLWLLAGTALGGFLLFVPIVFTTASSLGHMHAGGWLGLASLVSFVVAGALLPLSPSPRHRGPAAQPTGPVSTPAGWYPDPIGQARLRYWDGAAWTETTSA